MLYARSMNEDLDYKALESRYKFELGKSFELYIFNLYQLTKVAEYVKKDASKKASKLLPSEEDKNFSTRVYDNPLIRSLVNNEGLSKLIKIHKMDLRLDDDVNRLLYQDLCKNERYIAYLAKAEPEESDHNQAILSLYKLMVSSENYEEHLDDRYNNWVHDKSLIVGALKKTVKALPVVGEFYEEFRPARETTIEFGLDLLYKVTKLDAELLEMIKPVLKNWEAERVATIDMIFLKMALCEMLHFPTIPTKVTINEFVDLSKLYSTPKSKDFINGILDKLLKQLTEEKKINKQGRGLID